MKIVIVSAYYSEGMGYAENCLPKYLANLGHEVHVLSSTLNVYGIEPNYDKTYESFLGEANQKVGNYNIDGYTLHRLEYKKISTYIYIQGLYKNIKRISPDIVHVTEIGSINCFKLAAIKKVLGFKLFTETHQHLSVVKPYLKSKGLSINKLNYFLTRTLPTFLASLAVEKCYSIAPDCSYVANKFYGVPQGKIKLQPLGTDSLLFSPAISNQELTAKEKLRTKLGFSKDEIVLIYTGRFSEDKNPLILAKALEKLNEFSSVKVFGLFIGEGVQKEEILKCANTVVISFMKHQDLTTYYASSDIAVWPFQESMSMLDAASSGLPLVVSDKIGEYDRVDGNGKVYNEGNLESLVSTLASLIENKDNLKKMGDIGRRKMLEHYSWKNIALNIENDYKNSLK
jgi:glycosyltransferase involved in cell wall biosynthesis